MLAHEKESDHGIGICSPSWSCVWGTEKLNVPRERRAYCAKADVLNGDERRNDRANVVYERTHHDVYVETNGDEVVIQSVDAHGADMGGGHDYSKRAGRVGHVDCTHHDSYHHGDGSGAVMEHAWSHSPYRYCSERDEKEAHQSDHQHANGY